MKPNMKIAVVDERKKGRTLLADALFRAAIKIMAARGDPVRAAEEVAEIFRRAETDLKDSPGLESFLELVRDGIRAANERDRRSRLRHPQMVVSARLN
jgi:hypothetical protein